MLTGEASDSSAEMNEEEAIRHLTDELSASMLLDPHFLSVQRDGSTRIT